eukprot:TRINITY_DN2067_c0_g1_i2.p2 TRINITY_DN2067_c0_g1~~TRINITY_DN2067_c0_g1_i2.p2  ORF type:complete len:210 (-),score=25.68 TRINITY_DN2067_c0_g1_i2:93-722(-)
MSLYKSFEKFKAQPQYGAILSPESIQRAVRSIGKYMNKTRVRGFGTEGDTTAHITMFLDKAFPSVIEFPQWKSIKIHNQPGLKDGKKTRRADLGLYDETKKVHLVLIEIKRKEIFSADVEDQHKEQLEMYLKEKPKLSIAFGIMTTFLKWSFTGLKRGESNMSTYEMEMKGTEMVEEVVKLIRVLIIKGYEENGFGICQRVKPFLYIKK